MAKTKVFVNYKRGESLKDARYLPLRLAVLGVVFAALTGAAATQERVRLFPLLGLTLGVSTTSDLEKITKKNPETSAYSIDGANFYTEDGILDQLVVAEGFPAAWQALGFSMALSYNEWIILLKKLSFKIEVEREPTKVREGIEWYFRARLLVTDPSDRSYVLTLDFNGIDARSPDSKNTLYRVVAQRAQESKK